MKSTIDVQIPIAIVGMGMRLPGGIRDCDELWKALIQQRNLKCDVPKDRFNPAAFGKSTIALDQGYFLEDVNLKHFDSSFFSMSRGEMEHLDPQQRLLLEVVWECMENAGQASWRGSETGCFVGAFGEDFHDMLACDAQATGSRIVGASDFALANRLSYEYDLRGPSMTVRTSCSASLTALHLACQSLEREECCTAIVCGSNLILRPWMTLALDDHGVLSPSGLCKTFDAHADGYARGEAVTALCLKRLRDAIKDSDSIRGVIRATAVNHDGKSDGFSRPNGIAQEALIRTAYRNADIADASDTPFIECHGTGTPIGDPIEASALKKIFGRHQTYIGSVKPNVGHSEGASGITSIIKSILALERETIPPNMHFKTPNSKVFDDSRFVVPCEPIKWPVARPLRISINSFGVGGANAHLVLESAKYVDFGKKGDPNGAKEQIPKGTSAEILMLSAKSSSALTKQIEAVELYCELNNDQLGNVAYTLNHCREHLDHRSFSLVDAQKKIKFEPGRRILSSSPTIVFIFTGQGAQWRGMGKQLLDYPSFLDDIRKLDQVLQKCVEAPKWSLEGVLRADESDFDVNEGDIAQPLCSALQLSLVNLLRCFDISPNAVIGHSSGEIAAAYAAGRSTMEEAIENAYQRGIAASQMSGKGSMAVVGLSKSSIQRFIVSGVSIACENSPENVTVSGSEDAVDRVIKSVESEDKNIFTRKLRVQIPYHSQRMKEVVYAYEPRSSCPINSDTRPLFYSTLTGTIIPQDTFFRPSYWRENLENTVLFNTTMGTLLDDMPQDLILLEIGPHGALEGPVRQIVKAHRDSTASYVSLLRRGVDANMSFLGALGRLYAMGYPLTMEAVQNKGIPLTDLPRYPWQYSKELWAESRLSSAWRHQEHPHHELLGSVGLEASSTDPAWRNFISAGDIEWLADHKIGGDVVFPFAGYVALLGEAIRQMTGSRTYSLRQVYVKTAMLVRSDDRVEIITSAHKVRTGDQNVSPIWHAFSVSSFNGDEWVQHCVAQGRGALDTSWDDTANMLPAPLNTGIDCAQFYQDLDHVGFNFGPSFRQLKDVSVQPMTWQARCRVSSDPLLGDGGSYSAHPATIDSCLQLMIAAACRGQADQLQSLAMPTFIAEAVIQPSTDDMLAESVVSLSYNGDISGQTVAYSESTRKPLLSLKGVKCVPLNVSKQAKLAPPIASRLTWEPAVDFVDLRHLLHMSNSTYIKVALERLCCVCILQVAHILPTIKSTQGHFKKLALWFEQQNDAIRRGDWNHVVDEAQQWSSMGTDELLLVRKKIMLEIDGLSIDDLSAVGQLFVRLSDPHNMDKVFDIKVNPIELMTTDNALSKFYKIEAAMADHGRFMRTLAHSKPSLQVLEVGAGTGGQTVSVLEALTTQGVPDYSSYTFTDISAGFFGQARQMLESYPNLEYKVLDISQDPLDQGFSELSYDLIIAANVIHATPSLGNTLRNLCRLLKPDGYLLIRELISPLPVQFIHFIMGFFSGWWIGENDNRINESIVSIDRWDSEFEKAGLARRGRSRPNDTDNLCLFNDLVVTKRQPMARNREVIFLFHREKPSFGAVCESLFRQRGYRVTWKSLDKDWTDTKTSILSLVDVERPILAEISIETFNTLMSFFKKCSASILWISRLARIESVDPHDGLMVGLSRTLRNELASSLFTLEIQNTDQQAAEAVSQVFDKILELRASRLSRQYDQELSFYDGQIRVARYRWFPLEEDALVTDRPDLAKKLVVAHSGLLGDLAWESHVKKQEFGDCDVEIELCACGLNFKDLLCAMGIIKSSDGSLGGEGAGVITQVGSRVSNVGVGDRVVGVGWGLLASRVRVSQDHVVKIPDSLGFEEAATFGVCYLTAFYALIDVARVSKDKSVLIHSACGGVGLAALQICKHVGAEIYVTVGNEEKRQFVRSKYNIPDQRIFHSRNTAFLPQVLRATNGRGVDAVLNSLSGELLQASWQCVAEYGSMLEIGKRDILDGGTVSLLPFEKNRSFHGIDLTPFLVGHHGTTQRILKTCMSWLAEGKVSPLPRQVFSSDKVADAFRQMQRGQHIGKIVVSLGGLAAQPTNRKPIRVSLSSEATYFLAGGLGGIGKAITMWAFDRGARTFLFFSRSAGLSDHDKSFLGDLEARGCVCAAVAGDVGNLADVQRAVEAAPSRIAGVLHMCMVLKDTLASDMTFEDWATVQEPKARGAWNLHLATKDKTLDFFLLFGSISSLLGLTGQASYAAANAFMSSLVKYRQQRHLPCSIVNIGVMQDVGYLTRNRKALEILRSNDICMLTQNELLASLDLSIWHSLSAAGGTATHADEQQFGERHHLALGLAVTKSLSDPSLRLAGIKDLRFGFHDQQRSKNGASATETVPTSDDVLPKHAVIAADPGTADEALALEHLTKKMGAALCRILLYPEEDFHSHLRLSSIGMDSLVSVEFQSWCRQAIGAAISVASINNADTALDLAHLALRSLRDKYGVGGTGPR